MSDERVNWFSKLVTVLAYTFILAPMIIIVIISFNSGESIQFPPSGVSLRWYEYIVTGPTNFLKAVSYTHLDVYKRQRKYFL